MLVTAPEAATPARPASRLARLAALAVTGSMLVLGTAALASFSTEPGPAAGHAVVQQH